MKNTGIAIVSLVGGMIIGSALTMLFTSVQTNWVIKIFMFQAKPYFLIIAQIIKKHKRHFSP